ncbi:uncharacterized protein BJX67DRAFT_342762 [Aspergillus lucknowensis]|uniref:Uncharacterized protein n=1 Tax=Aspergillus lucknowensis TaxID=176173 RepID=A0ABR4M4Y5_9EURO
MTQGPISGTAPPMLQPQPFSSMKELDPIRHPLFDVLAPRAVIIPIPTRRSFWRCLSRWYGSRSLSSAQVNKWTSEVSSLSSFLLQPEALVGFDIEIETSSPCWGCAVLVVGRKRGHPTLSLPWSEGHLDSEYFSARISTSPSAHIETVVAHFRILGRQMVLLRGP